MAITPVTSAVDVYWVDSKNTINTNLKALDQSYTVTTTATPATGTCAVQFVFKDPNTGATINYPISGFGYLASDAAGLTKKTPTTGIAVLTNGQLNTIPSLLSTFHFVTNATGQLGMTITTTASSNYVVFILPNGKLLVSTVCTTT